MELQCKPSEKELARFSEAQPEVGVAKVRSCGASYCFVRASCFLYRNTTTTFSDTLKNSLVLLAAKLFLSNQHKVSTKKD